MNTKVYYVVNDTPGSEFAYKLFSKGDLQRTLRRDPDAHLASERDYHAMRGFVEKNYIDYGFHYQVISGTWVDPQEAS